MKKIFLTFITFLLVGCSERETKPTTTSNARFIIIYQQTSFDGGTQIIKDTKTNKEYLFHKSGYGGGLTQL